MKKRGGFTLIELLVVIAIIGLITTMSLIVLRGKVMAARDAKRRADMATLMVALELYKFDRTGYPGWCGNHNGHLVCISSEDGFSLPMLDYMKPSPPIDPGHHDHDYYNTYYYYPGLSGHAYVLFFMLEKGPQEDYCNVGSQDFDGHGLVPWSTRCPD